MSRTVVTIEDLSHPLSFLSGCPTTERQIMTRTGKHSPTLYTHIKGGKQLPDLDCALPHVNLPQLKRISEGSNQQLSNLAAQCIGPLRLGFPRQAQFSQMRDSWFSVLPTPGEFGFQAGTLLVW